jgi:hypothetical protein
MASPDPTEQEIREYLDRWSAGGFFRARALGSRSDLGPITAWGAYTFRLRTQYEERRVTRASTPYRTGPVDQDGKPPGPWDIPIGRPEDFEERVETRTVPHTERIENCPTCRGRGFGDCQRCAGDGQVACGACGGSGMRSQLLMRPQPVWNGRFMSTIMVPYTIPVACGCAGGRVTCSDCDGTGHQDCTPCAGGGTVKTFERLTVTFRAPERVETRYPEGLPEAGLRDVVPEVVAQERGPWLDGCPLLPETVEDHAEAMIDQSQAINHAEVRILFQRLVVERVPVIEVPYRYRGGVERRLWLVGPERRVVVPDAPLAWGRTLGVVASGLLALGGLAAWLLPWARG